MRVSLQSRRASIDQCTKFRFSLICPPVRYLLGLPPQTRLVVLADCISFTSAQVRKSIHSVARPLPTKSCDFAGYPISAAEKSPQIFLGIFQKQFRFTPCFSPISERTNRSKRKELSHHATQDLQHPQAEMCCQDPSDRGRAQSL